MSEMKATYIMEDFLIYISVEVVHDKYKKTWLILHI